MLWPADALFQTAYLTVLNRLYAVLAIFVSKVIFKLIEMRRIQFTLISEMV